MAHPKPIRYARRASKAFEDATGARVVAGLLTLGGSEVALGGFKAADALFREKHGKPHKRGHHKGKPGTHPHPSHRQGKGMPRMADGKPHLGPDGKPGPRFRRGIDRAHLGRIEAGLHGPVLVDRERSRFIHPPFGRVNHDRAQVGRIRAGLPPVKHVLSR